MPRILLVEDEPAIADTVLYALRMEGFEARHCLTGGEALRVAAGEAFDLAILDVGLPDIGGFALCRELRRAKSQSGIDLPVIFLTAHDAEAERIMGLEIGADDYVTKPFGVGELLARVRAALRGALRSAAGTPILRFGNTVVDLEKRMASRDGAVIRMTPIEFRLLAMLAKHPGMVVTHRQLLTEVWGPTHAADTHYLRIYMKQLRDKLEADPVRPRHLLTETGIGYRMVPDE